MIRIKYFLSKRQNIIWEKRNKKKIWKRKNLKIKIENHNEEIKKIEENYKIKINELEKEILEQSNKNLLKKRNIISIEYELNLKERTSKKTNEEYEKTINQLNIKKEMLTSKNLKCFKSKK